MSSIHTFVLSIRKSRIFTLVVDGISDVTSWFLAVKQNIRMTIIFSALSISATVVNLKRIKITISSTLLKLISHLSKSISLHRIKIVALLRQISEISIGLNLKRILITPIFRMIYKLGNVSMKIPKIGITADVLIANFHTLSEYDSEILSTIDGSALSDLDYTIT
jgi:hypothetical protein